MKPEGWYFGEVMGLSSLNMGHGVFNWDHVTDTVPFSPLTQLIFNPHISVDMRQKYRTQIAEVEAVLAKAGASI
jgi:hypothetical protein